MQIHLVLILSCWLPLSKTNWRRFTGQTCPPLDNPAAPPDLAPPHETHLAPPHVTRLVPAHVTRLALPRLTRLALTRDAFGSARSDAFGSRGFSFGAPRSKSIASEAGRRAVDVCREKTSAAHEKRGNDPSD